MNSSQDSDHADAGENTASTPSLSRVERAGGLRGLSSQSSRSLDADAATGADVATGSVLRTRYVLEEVVGRGGFSLVFRANDLHRALPLESSPHFVAVKLLQAEFRDDPQALLRLRREFRQTQRLSHPRVVRVFDLDCDGDIWFMTMELLTGETVKTWMQTARDPQDALKIIYACCEALEHAHSLGIVHGDLKPTNVVLGEDGNVTLIDFGSAANPDGAATTALYASPQVLAGKSAQISDDIFSLACLSYGLLSGGRHPFGRRPSLEDGRAKVAPTYVSAIPRELFEVIERGLTVEPHRRPASACEFRRQLIEAAERIAIASAASARAATTEDVHHEVLYPDFQHHDVVAFRHAPSDVVVPRNVTRGAISLANVIMLTIATLSAVALFRIGTHRPVMRVAMTANAPVAGPVTGSAVAPVTTPVAAAPIATAAARPDSGPAIEAASPTPDNGVISFDAASVHASPTQTLVAVSVRRLRSTRSVGAFIWRVEGGSAQPGTDFGPTRPERGRFNRGESVRTLFIPLVGGRALSQPARARTFSVVLEPVAGGPELGRISRTTVTIDPPPDAIASAAYQVRALDRRGGASPQSSE